MVNNYQDQFPDGIHVFIHAALLDDWRVVMQELLSAVHTSGLFAAATSVRVGVVGKGHIEFAEPSPQQLFHYNSHRRYEYPTLQALRTRCIELPNAAVLYLHTKGVTRRGKEKMAAWRNYMLHFLVEQFPQCLELLQEHDVVGVDWKPDHRLFAGNFWWARAAYVQHLGVPQDGSRWFAEKWIGTGEPRVCCRHRSGNNHYCQRYPRAAYSDTPQPPVSEQQFIMEKQDG